MPAGLIVRWINRLTDSTLHIYAQNKRMEQFTTAEAEHLRQRKQHRGHRPRWMNNRGELRVVVVKHVRANAVDKCRVHGIQSFCSTHNRGLRRSRKRRA